MSRLCTKQGCPASDIDLGTDAALYVNLLRLCCDCRPRVTAYQGRWDESALTLSGALHAVVGAVTVIIGQEFTSENRL